MIRFLFVIVLSGLLGLLTAIASHAQQPQKPATVIPITPPPPATIGANLGWSSPCLAVSNYQAVTIAAAMSGAATLQLQRYADPQCSVPIGTSCLVEDPSETTTLVPCTPMALSQPNCPSSSFCGNITVNNMPMQGLIFTIQNSTGSVNTVVVARGLGGPR